MGRFIILIIFGGILFVFVRFFYSVETIKDVCRTVEGERIEALKSTVAAHDLRFAGDYSVKGIIHSTRSMGRAVCFVSLEDGLVKESIYVFND